MFLHLRSELNKLIITVIHKWSNNLHVDHSNHFATLDETPDPSSGHSYRVAMSDRTRDLIERTTPEAPVSVSVSRARVSQTSGFGE